MTTEKPEINVKIKADAKELENELDRIQELSRELGKTITDSFGAAVREGKQFSDVLRSVALGLASTLSNRLFDQAMKSLEGLAGGTFNKVLGGLAGLLPFARGGVVSGQHVVPFAGGGVVAAPTYFPLSGSRLGVMGEAGAEAIMPLARGPDGRLGVRAQAPRAAAGGVQLVVNTPDAQSFTRSEAEITAMMARALRRGRRGL